MSVNLYLWRVSSFNFAFVSCDVSAKNECEFVPPARHKIHFRRDIYSSKMSPPRFLYDSLYDSKIKIIMMINY